MTQQPWRTFLSCVLGGAAALYIFGQQHEASSPQQVQQIFAESCAGCHQAGNAQGKLRLDTLEGLAQGGVSGPAVTPGNSAGSLLVQRLTSANPTLRMPPGGAPLGADKIATIRRWIDSGAPGLAALPATVDYARDVKPLLQRSCYGCHSGTRPQAELRLDVKAGAMRGGLSGAVIVAGDAERSRLVHRLEGRGGEQRMPLKGQPLSSTEIALIRKWIDAGAPWPDEGEPAVATIEKHWSYRKPVRPPVPRVKNSSLVRNPIDAFLLAKLEKEGLSFSPEASRETLIRRLSLDLIGLPPSPEEVEAFLRDQRPDAYERLVERLLDSPHYGERWARPWLDLARYADTNGFEKDRRRTMYLYRDWVIRALNQDMPFDQFVVEQLAGDMLPNATVEQQIASGFHRNTMYNEEGGVDKDEAMFEVLVDRVNTTGAVFLATSIGCAQCHNHKYDPFTQKEYYQLMAFFNNTWKEPEEYGDTSVKYREAELELPTPEQAAKRAEIKERIKFLETKLKTQTAELDAEQANWERSLREAGTDWKLLEPLRLNALNGAQLRKLEDGSILVGGPNPQQETYVIESGAVGLSAITGVRLEALPHESLPRGGPGRDVYGNFILTWMRVEVGDGSQWRTIYFNRVLNDDGRGPGRHLWTIDASREEKRLPRQLVLATRKPFALRDGERIRVTVHMRSDFVGQSIGRFRLSATDVSDPSLIVKIQAKLRPALETDPALRTAEQKKQLADYHRSVAASLKAARDELKELQNQLEKLSITTALVMKENDRGERPFDFIRTRGSFSAKAEKVWADVPAVLHPMPPGAPKNRLGLAQWIASRENPLTARVTMNRIWEQYFGRGIVETSEDFGTQGAAPTHPELLDWLAVEFMDRNWSLKAMHRLIVGSQAYRQSSKLTPELLTKDPYNKLISRGPRFRMEAEMIRDHGLAASGLLSRKIGGPSVFPYQPEGVWDVPYSNEKWIESPGEDKYRRGIYTFIRRSALYPSMMNFDATSREFCTVRRIRTNTPLQALTTLNDPAFFEMAQALAKRVLNEGGTTENSRLKYAFRLCTSRLPKSAEMDALQSWLANERNYFQQHPEEAAKLAPQARDATEQAAWVMLSNVLLNLDEALTKE
ncbi:MAG: PSD1 and planctomycete cytochrome C domain-containing protein [Bryobacteraceae bacterium]|nr:PSD1 and planctomycete cytochrome C domain-containing protein [Bryobacteraceae bacterium]MDW8376520.1 PSD1 and planctomycete cytochrome C domain-containing protein [Bryobacterales bacterium]